MTKDKNNNANNDIDIDINNNINNISDEKNLSDKKNNKNLKSTEKAKQKKSENKNQTKDDKEKTDKEEISKQETDKKEELDNKKEDSKKGSKEELKKDKQENNKKNQKDITTESSDENNLNKKEKTTKKTSSKQKKTEKKEKEFTAQDYETLIEELEKKESGIIRFLTTKRFTSKVSRDILLTRIVTVSLVFIALTISVLYFLSYTYINSGYGIGIMTERELDKSISLSDSSDFQRMTVGLRAKGIDSMDNITYDWLPNNLHLHTGGSNNGENYIAYTFYVINSGNENLTYNSVLSIKFSTKQVETAIRVMIFKNNTPTVYTHTYEEQIDSEIEKQAKVEEFHTPDIIAQNQSLLEKGKYEKYTVVIWLEGEDIDCVDDKRSGELQLSWNFYIIEDNEEIT